MMFGVLNRNSSNIGSSGHCISPEGFWKLGLLKHCVCKGGQCLIHSFCQPVLLEGYSRESSEVIQVSMESNVSLLSSTVLTMEDLNISHSGVFGRELRRIKERTLSSTEYFIPARRDSIVLSAEIHMFRDSRGPIPYAAEELMEEIEGGGDVGSLMEFDKGIKKCLGVGLLTRFHEEGVGDM